MYTQNNSYQKSNYQQLAENKLLYNETSSLTLDLENLSLQYSNLLTQYEQAVADYNNVLTQKSNGTILPMMSIKGQSFWGTSGISSSNVSTIAGCKALCASNKTCSGATYDTKKNICSLRTGDGNLINTSDNYYALISQEKYLMMNIKNINSQLININTQILNKINSGKPIFEGEYKLRSEKAQALIDNYLNLLQQKEKIYQTIEEQYTLDQTQTEGNIKINQNYYSFLLLLALSIIFIVILYFLLKSRNNTTSSLTDILNPYRNTNT
jgi:hypothetical protein